MTLLSIVLLCWCFAQAVVGFIPVSLTNTGGDRDHRYYAGGGEGGKGPIEVTPELIKHTATLAQLNFDDDEIARLIPRFQAFLSFVDKMKEVPDDVDADSSSSLPAFKDVVRADKASVFPNQDGIFANMAKQEDAYLVVPKVGEEDV